MFIMSTNPKPKPIPERRWCSGLATRNWNHKSKPKDPHEGSNLAKITELDKTRIGQARRDTRQEHTRITGQEHSTVHMALVGYFIVFSFVTKPGQTFEFPCGVLLFYCCKYPTTYGVRVHTPTPTKLSQSLIMHIF